MYMKCGGVPSGRIATEPCNPVSPEEVPTHTGTLPVRVTQVFIGLHEEFTVSFEYPKSVELRP